MVVLTVVLQKNGETVYFDEPIPQVHFMRLVSCSLYNSWHNLTRVGTMTFKTIKKTLASIPQGHYNIVSLVNELEKSFKIKKNISSVSMETNNPNSPLKIAVNFETNDDTEQIKVSHDLARLIGVGNTLGQNEYIKKLNSPSTYFIHCDLIDRSNNFFNGKRSDVLAKFDIIGMPYAKITYPSPPQEALRECSTGQHVKQITLSVKDESGKMFDFNGLPLEFVLEIN